MAIDLIKKKYRDVLHAAVPYERSAEALRLGDIYILEGNIKEKMITLKTLEHDKKKLQNYVEKAERLIPKFPPEELKRAKKIKAMYKIKTKINGL